MNKIGDDELDLIVSRVTDPDDRKSASRVCKGWWLMEGLTRSSLRVKSLVHLPRLLARYPNLTTFETPRSVSNADLALVAKSCPKLETFILEQVSFREEIRMQGIKAVTGRGDDEKALRFMIIVSEATGKVKVNRYKGMQQVGDEGLCALADGCPKLSKIVIKRASAGLLGIVAMITSAAHNLTHLDLGKCCSDLVLEAIGSSSCAIRFLNLSSCHKITDAGLRGLANGSCSKTIKELNLARCYNITDAGVSLLWKMRVLEELDLDCCVELTDVGLQAISTIQTLKKLNLTCLFNLTEKTYVALARNCMNLEVLILQRSGGGVTTASIDAFSGHKFLRSLNLVGCLSDDFRVRLDRLAHRCPSLESIMVEESFRETLLQELRESTVSRFMEFVNC